MAMANGCGRNRRRMVVVATEKPGCGPKRHDTADCETQCADGRKVRPS